MFHDAGNSAKPGEVHVFARPLCVARNSSRGSTAILRLRGLQADQPAHLRAAAEPVLANEVIVQALGRQVEVEAGGEPHGSAIVDRLERGDYCGHARGQ